MPDSSARLSLPFLLPAQAQKHVTHNEALARLDLLVQLTVEGFGATTPPAQPDAGQIWALGPAPSGAWDGQGNRLAAWLTGGWVFVAPQPGWLAAQGSDLRIWNGADWVIPDQPVIETLPGLGINTSFDPVNRLAVASDATLLTHDGAGHQLKLNKATSADTASLLFQNAFSGRAEIGLAGNEDFSVKVSPEGSTWFDALLVARTTGAVSFPNGLGAPLAISDGGTGGITLEQARANLEVGFESADRGRLVQALALPDLPGNDSGFSAGIRFLLLGRVDSNNFRINGDIRYGRPTSVTTHADQGMISIISHRSGASRQTSSINRFTSSVSNRRTRIVQVIFDGNPWLAVETFGASSVPLFRTGIVFSGFLSGEEIQWVNASDVSDIVEPNWGVPSLEWNNRALYSTENVLGTVSQSGGAPTGAILQRGSNANGEFVRFADGTQICTNGNAPVTTDPAAFVGTVTSIDGNKLRLGRWF